MELGHSPFPLLHGLGLVVLVMVHPEEVQDAVHDQQGHLVVVGPGVVRRVAERHRRADHDVAQHHGHVGRLRRRRRARSAGVGAAAALDRLLVDRERQHVGRPVLARNRLLRSDMACSSTNSIDSSASPRTPSSASTAWPGGPSAWSRRAGRSARRRRTPRWPRRCDSLLRRPGLRPGQPTSVTAAAGSPSGTRQLGGVS